MGGAILHQIVRLEMPSCPNPFRVQSDNCVWPPFVFRFSFLFAISRDIHTVVVHVASCPHGTYVGRTLRVVKLSALLKWVGVPEANAPAIRKEWFSIVWRQRDRRCISRRSTSARLTHGSGCQNANCRTCRGQTSAATCFCLCGGDGLGSCTTGLRHCQA